MTEGRVVTLTSDICRGWARITTLPHYAVTVHLVLDGRLQGSAIADRTLDTSDDPLAPSGCWFEIDVPSEVATRLAECRVLVGESGTYLQDAKRESRVETASPASLSAPTSFRDALHRGLSASDVIALLYLDILRRPADNEGLRHHLDELERGRGSLDSFRRSLLESEEYRRLDLRVREAPGGTFAKTIVYSSSTRRMGMEQHAPAFQQRRMPLRRKLLDFLPGLVAVPGAVERLLESANEGLPEREVFFQALSKLSRRPSLIVSHPREFGLEQDRDATLDDSRVVAVTCASPLFAVGWNKLERSPTNMFRWMEQIGILINPRPEHRLERLEVSVNGWYGGMDQTMTAVASDTVLACERREDGSNGATLIFTSPDTSPTTACRIALVAAAATCPWHHDGTPDVRLLSCQVTAAKFLYAESAA